MQTIWYFAELFCFWDLNQIFVVLNCCQILLLGIRHKELDGIIYKSPWLLCVLRVSKSWTVVSCLWNGSEKDYFFLPAELHQSDHSLPLSCLKHSFTSDFRFVCFWKGKEVLLSNVIEYMYIYNAWIRWWRLLFVSSLENEIISASNSLF